MGTETNNTKLPNFVAQLRKRWPETKAHEPNARRRAARLSAELVGQCIEWLATEPAREVARVKAATNDDAWNIATIVIAWNDVDGLDSGQVAKLVALLVRATITGPRDLKRIRDLHEQNELLEKDRVRLTKKVASMALFVELARSANAYMQAVGGGVPGAWPDKARGDMFQVLVRLLAHDDARGAVEGP